ncbi:hypothetical protein D3C78_1206700 [compost metagenome]
MVQVRPGHDRPATQQRGLPERGEVRARQALDGRDPPHLRGNRRYRAATARGAQPGCAHYHGLEHCPVPAVRRRRQWVAGLRRSPGSVELVRKLQRQPESPATQRFAPGEAGLVAQWPDAAGRTGPGAVVPEPVGPQYPAVLCEVPGCGGRCTLYAGRKWRPQARRHLWPVPGG